MKRILGLMVACVAVCCVGSAQTPKNQNPAKPSEQKEIKADKHLEKEIQQKQLSGPPERLEQPSVKKEDVEKTGSASTTKKGKNKKKIKVKKN